MAKNPKLKFEGHKGAPYKGEDNTFINACQDAGVEPTTRQYSKWNQRKGRAWAKRPIENKES